MRSAIECMRKAMAYAVVVCALVICGSRVAEAGPPINRMCPVMTDEEIDPELTVEHEGCTGRVRLSWLSKLRNAYRIQGTRGSIEGGSYEWGSYNLRANGGPARRIQTAEKVRSFEDLAGALIDNFVAVVRDGAEPIVAGRDVLPSIETIEACYARRARFELPWHEACERIADVR